MSHISDVIGTTIAITFIFIVMLIIINMIIIVVIISIVINNVIVSVMTSVVIVGVGAIVDIVFICCKTVNVVIMIRSRDVVIVIGVIVAIDIMSGVSCVVVRVVKIWVVAVYMVGRVVVSVCITVVIVCSGRDVSIVIDIISMYVVTESVLYLYHASRTNSKVVSGDVFIHSRSV
jgi:hypothetical protein